MGKGVFNLLWEKYSSWVISVESGKHKAFWKLYLKIFQIGSPGIFQVKSPGKCSLKEYN